MTLSTIQASASSIRPMMAAAVLAMLLLISQRRVESANMGIRRSITAKKSSFQQQQRTLDEIPPWFDYVPDSVPPVASPTDSPTLSPTEYETYFFTDSPTEGETDIDTLSPTEGATNIGTAFPQTIDTAIPTAPPTISPTVVTASPTVNTTTAAPTDPLTAAPTESPTGSPSEFPTQSPTEQPESYLEITTKSNGGLESNCSFVPESKGASVTETLNLEYFLYLSNRNSEDVETDENTTTTTVQVQDIVDSLQSKLHGALTEIAFNCSDLAKQDFSIVKLSNDGPGTDLVGASCSLDAGPSAASVCHQVLAQMTVTMWFSGNTRRRSRGLQTASLGGQDAFYQFVDWLESAFALLTNADEGIVGTKFKGFSNLGSLGGGTDLSHPQQFGDKTSAFIDSKKSVDNSGLPFSYGHAMIVLAGLVMITLLVLVLGRRWRRGRAVKKHLKEVDDLHLDAIDEMDENPVIVDDESLFQEERPLPEEFEVQLEDLNHDYRTCASPSCRACLRRKDPQFVLTNLRDMERSLEVRQRWFSPMSNNVSDTQIL